MGVPAPEPSVEERGVRPGLDTPPLPLAGLVFELSTPEEPSEAALPLAVVGFDDGDDIICC